MAKLFTKTRTMTIVRFIFTVLIVFFIAYFFSERNDLIKNEALNNIQETAGIDTNPEKLTRSLRAIVPDESIDP